MSENIEEVGVELEKVEEEEAVKKVEELDQKIREAVREAIKEVFEDLLAPDSKEEKEEKSIKLETEKEELPKCPRNLSWLQKMFEIFPEEILKNSKLWKYRKCLEKEANE